MPIESRPFKTEDFQLSTVNGVVEFNGSQIIPCGMFNKATWQWVPNTSSACTLTIEKSNDGTTWHAATTASAAAVTLMNSDGNRFTSVAIAVDSNFQRARVTAATSLSSRATVSARFWAEV